MAADHQSVAVGVLQPEATITNWIRAGGALAVFVIVYFYSLAPLAIWINGTISDWVLSSVRLI